MENRINSELDLDGNPLVSDSSYIISRYMPYAISLSLYLFPLSIGLCYYEFFMQSPIVKELGKVLGPIFAAASWIVAFFSLGITFGKFEWAKEVIGLYDENNYQIAITLTYLFSPIAGVIKRSINRTTAAIDTRVGIVIISGCISMISLIIVISNLSKSNNTSAYLFSIFISGIIYLFVFNINDAYDRSRYQRNHNRQPQG